MSGVVALCHFCEAHGPRALLCTYCSAAAPACGAPGAGAGCAACGALGADTVLVSKCEGAEYRSRDAAGTGEVPALLRQAAIRSLTCEVSQSKEGGVVYFSEGTSGHILSFTFQLSDCRARGLKRWFSCLVLMKDQAQLLAMMPFFTEHMQKTGKDLQQMAEKVFEADQKICSQRALRLTTGRSDHGPLRSLKQLTGEDNIFHKLHMTFTWMLHAGARTYMETLYTSRDMLSRLDPKAVTGSIFVEKACDLTEGVPLRDLERLLGRSVFRVLLYCVLSGIEVLLKSENPQEPNIVTALTRLLPISETSAKLPNIRTVNITSDITPTASLCVVERVTGPCSDNYECKWMGTLPDKCPTLMTQIESAMNNSMFNDATLDQHIKSLQLEWLGITRTLRSAINSSGSPEPIVKLKQVFGVTPHDEHLVDYWMNTFCS